MEYLLEPETIIAGHFHETDSYITQRPNGRKDWLIVYTLDGEGYFKTRTGEKLCRSGDISLLKGGVPHQYGTSSGKVWHFVWAHFPRLSETAYIPDEEVFVLNVNSEFRRKRIYRSFKKIIKDSLERASFWQELCENSIKEILLLMAQSLDKNIDSRIERVLHLLSQDMMQKVRIEELAKAVNLSASRLSHLFKKETGESILETLNQMRLRQAAMLLEHTDRTAAEVALDVGFQSYNHFAESFRRLYGISPRGYKNKPM
jgi:AraC family transcriptional regulator of arabinose operon